MSDRRHAWQTEPVSGVQQQACAAVQCSTAEAGAVHHGQVCPGILEGASQTAACHIERGLLPEWSAEHH